MANNPQQSKNATDQAMAALEDALNVHIAPRTEPRVDAPASSDKPDTFEFESPPTADLFRDPEPIRDTGAGREAEGSSHWLNADGTPRTPANDDRASIGLVLQGLRRRRARAPYAVATVLSVAWAAGAAALAFLSRGELSSLLGTPNVAIATVAGIVAAIVVPVVFFYVLAHLFSRSQDLRLVAESMAEVTMRLAQPVARVQTDRQGDSRQPRELRVAMQQLARLAPGSVRHYQQQRQFLRSSDVRKRERLLAGKQQTSLMARQCQALIEIVETLTHQQLGIAQPQRGEARGVERMAGFAGVLKDQ